ncbi:hypothetical protein RJ639_034260 [Escallonia herrerae]|uniref:Dolichyl-diphosphooligosaccharide--protein glycosyltransferase 48 kDa subunit n=1 Tax=Escallonia herrerae TaxID=1293975 RepID=A0AA89BEN9_9ASTE|nr:hypothetical protein RJ639_034260 [Escallonia herrerae]
MANLSAVLITTLISLLPILTHSFSPESPTDRRILVLLDDFATRSSHSIFFNSLQNRGFELDFKLADDPKLALHRYGQYLHDALILFCPAADRLGGGLDLAAILEFVDSGHDLIVGADVNASDLIRNIAAESGDASAVVIDHTSYAVSETDGDHTLIASYNFIESDAPVLFKGIGHSLNAANSLGLKVLSASSAAYSASPKSKLLSPPALAGSAISLARNNARIIISGSLDLFSNRFFKSGVQKAGSSKKYERSGNEQFTTELSKWVFHERGHLKAVNVRHHKVGETDEPAMYRINDDLEYAVDIYEWSGTRWEPYVANDVQVQFYMMSPYVPDVYGVFQFKVEYQRLGYTSLSLSKQIPVRPFRHNEYERFITTAFPYYGASFSTMAGFFIFSIVYLYNK